MVKRFAAPAVFLFYCALALLITAPSVCHLFTHLPAPSRDCLLNCWILSTEISHLHSPGNAFWNGNIFYPSRGTLTYSEHLMGYLPLAWLLYRVTGNMAATINILTMASFALAGLGMFLLVRHLTGNSWAAVAAGTIFGFSPFRISHINHLNILAMHWLPFILLFWHRAMERKKVIDFGGFLFFFFLEGLSCVQLTIYLLLLFPLITLGRLAGKKDFPAELARWGAAYLLLGSLLLPFFLPYYRTLHALGILNTPYPNWSASILSFITPCSSLRLWGWLTPMLGRGQDPETYLFPGIITVLMALAGLRSFYSPGKSDAGSRETLSYPYILRALDVLVISLSVLITILVVTGGFDLPLGPFMLTFHSPALISTLCALAITARLGLDRKWRAKLKDFLKALPPDPALYGLLVLTGTVFSFYGPFVLLGALFPPLGSMRVSSRVFIIALAGLSVLGGYGFCALCRQRRSPGKLLFLIVALVLLESLPAPLPLTPLPAETEEVCTALETMPSGSVILEFPLDEDEINAGYMYAAARHRMNLINGYSGVTPRYYECLIELFREFPSDKSTGALEQFGADFVLLHRGRISPSRLKVMEQCLAGDTRFHLVRRSRDLAVYSFSPAKKGTGPQPSITLFPLSRKGWKISALPDKKLVEKSSYLIDNILRTYWTTGRPAQKGDAITIDMGASHLISGCTLFQGTDFSFYLRTYQLQVSDDGEHWEVMRQGWCDSPPFVTYFADPGNPYFFISFKPVKARHVRILSIDMSNYPWTVHEVKLYGPAPAGEPPEELLPDRWRKELPLPGEQE